MNCYYVDVVDCYYYKEENDSSLVLNQKKIELEVVPNPFSESIQLKISNFDEKKDQSITIYSISGRVILQQNIEDNNFRINLTGYRSGLYFLKYKNGNQNLTRKIIKQ